ncbi:hypothetical protein J2Y69_003444, partial [Microbacterium resistens]|nr:hypothetical protein [Microbacterium resistens]
DRYSLTIARWLASVYDTVSPARNPTTPRDATQEMSHAGQEMSQARQER